MGTLVHNSKVEAKIMTSNFNFDKEKLYTLLQPMSSIWKDGTVMQIEAMFWWDLHN